MKREIIMILVLLADGFEEIEALTPVDMLRRAGENVITVGMSGNIARGAHGISVLCDKLPEDIDLSSLKTVVFPGGMPGALNLDGHPFTDKVIEAALNNGAHIAAICAAPLLLGRRGLLEGVRATCYPGFEGELHGALIDEEIVVTDGKITTAKGMGAALPFSEELVRIASGESAAAEISKGIMKK